MSSTQRHTIFMNTNYKFGNSFCEPISKKQKILQWMEPIMDYKDTHQILVMVWRTNFEVDGIGVVTDSQFDNSNIGLVQLSFAAQLDSSKEKSFIITSRTAELNCW